MINKKLYVIILFLMIAVFSMNTYPVQANEPTDITNHWAQDYILNLINRDILNVYPDETFRPDHPITRGDFSQALAKELNLLPVNSNQFADLNEYAGKSLVNALVEEKIINGYPDGTFRPDNELTKAEIITVMVKALGIKNEEETIYLNDYNAYSDISENHWALNNIKIAKKIKLTIDEDNPENKFYPDRLTTRAEAAKLLVKLDNLTGNTGYITDLYPTSQKVSINLLDGNREVYNTSDETLVGRNNRIVPLDDILSTDKVFVIADDNLNLKYIKAYGMVTKEDLATEVSNITEGLLTTSDVNALAEGDINFLKPKLLSSVKEQLINEGLTNQEVDAIMSTNWNQLEVLSKNRLAEAIAIESGLPLDITRSLLEGDWDKIKTYAQIEVVQRLVQGVLNSDLIS